MHQSFQTNSQRGFSLLELTIVMTLMLIVGGAVFGLMRDSLKVTVATYELTDAQENMRATQEYINRDLFNAGDGLRSITNIRLPQAFVTNYLTRNPVTDPATPGIINLGIITSDNNVPAGTAVPLSAPAATVRAGTDRQTILESDPTFTAVALPAPASIAADGSTITIPAAYPLNNFTIGEIYFLTSSDGGTFGTITGIDPATRRLSFAGGAANGDPYGLNLTGANGHITAISAGGTFATSLQRMRIIHYYVNSNGLLMRRVFGVRGVGFRESPVAERVVNVQFNYSLVAEDASGNVVPSSAASLTTSGQQRGVRQVEVRVTVETPHALQKGTRPQQTTSTSTSVRNMQFREALQP